MRSIKRLAALLLTMVMLALSGCTAARQSRPYSVYLISKSASTEFWKSVFAGANAAKSEYNVDLTILAPETEEEYEVQNDYVRQAIESRADAIVFSAISYTGNAEAINEAVAAGIRVVVIDCDVDSDGVSVRIGTDNVAAGRMTGEAAMNAEEGDVVLGIVNCFVETQNCQERERGLREALLGDARVKGIYVVNVPTDAEQAKLDAERLVQEHALHRADADRGRRRAGRAESVCDGLSRRGEGMAGIAGHEVRQARADRHDDADRHKREHVHAGKPEGTVFLQLKKQRAEARKEMAQFLCMSHKNKAKFLEGSKKF